jgi:hypothetical protein
MRRGRLTEPCRVPDDPEHDEPAPESEEFLMIWKPDPLPSRSTTPEPAPSDPDEPAAFSAVETDEQPGRRRVGTGRRQPSSAM